MPNTEAREGTEEAAADQLSLLLQQQLLQPNFIGSDTLNQSALLASLQQPPVPPTGASRISESGAPSSRSGETESLSFLTQNSRIGSQAFSPRSASGGEAGADSELHQLLRSAATTRTMSSYANTLPSAAAAALLQESGTLLPQQTGQPSAPAPPSQGVPGTTAVSANNSAGVVPDLQGLLSAAATAITALPQTGTPSLQQAAAPAPQAQLPSSILPPQASPSQQLVPGIPSTTAVSTSGNALGAAPPDLQQLLSAAAGAVASTPNATALPQTRLPQGGAAQLQVPQYSSVQPPLPHDILLGSRPVASNSSTGAVPDLQQLLNAAAAATGQTAAVSVPPATLTPQAQAAAPPQGLLPHGQRPTLPALPTAALAPPIPAATTTKTYGGFSEQNLRNLVTQQPELTRLLLQALLEQHAQQPPQPQVPTRPPAVLPTVASAEPLHLQQQPLLQLTAAVAAAPIQAQPLRSLMRVETSMDHADDDASSGDSGGSSKQAPPRDNKNSKSKVAKAAPRSRKKRKRPIRKKDPNMPKRPLSAYNLFFRDERAKLAEATAHLDTGTKKRSRDKKPRAKVGFETLARGVASKWRELDETSLQYYRQLAAEDGVRYNNEMDEYRRRYLPDEEEDEGDEDEDEEDEQDTAEQEEQEERGGKRKSSRKAAAKKPPPKDSDDEGGTAV